jgi:hypothetical protein
MSPDKQKERDELKAQRTAGKRQYTKKQKSEEIMGNETNDPKNTDQNQSNPVENNQAAPLDNIKSNSSDQPNTTFEPFQGATKDRSYATPEIDQNLTGEIPELTFTAPKIDFKPGGGPSAGGPAASGAPGAPGATAAPNAIIPPNPMLSNVSPEERRIAAEQMAETAINAYDRLHGLGRWYCKTSEEDLMEAAFDGKIDIEERLPIAEEPITLMEFTQDFNNQVDTNFVVSQQWKDRVKPPLTRICEKNGWGLNDETTVLLAVLEDVSSKIGMIVGLKKTYKKISAIYEKIHKAKKEETALLEEQEQARKKAFAAEEGRLAAMREAAQSQPQAQGSGRSRDNGKLDEMN